MNPTAADPGAIVFWSVAGVFLLAVTGRLLWSAFRAQAPDMAATPRLYAQHQQELQDAVAQGEVSAEELPRLSRDLAKATLDDAARAGFTLKPRSRLEHWTLALVILIAVPGIALPVYLRYGSPAPPAPGERPNHHMDTAQMVEELERRIAVAPDDPEPRLWLARVYMSESKYDKAVEALAEVNRLVPNQAPVLLQYADALAMRDQGRIGEEARALIDAALRVEPANVTGLWLAGVAAEQAGDVDAALEALVAARSASLEADLPVEEIEAQISAIASRHGKPVPTFVDTAPAGAPEAAAAARTAGASEESKVRDGGSSNPVGIEVSVALAPETASTLPASTPVFILARAVAGPPMPLAVKRVTLGDLPLTLVLDESLAMSPELTLAKFPEVIVVARIAVSGQPIAQAGDIEAKSAPVPTRAGSKLSLTLDSAAP